MSGSLGESFASPDHQPPHQHAADGGPSGQPQSGGSCAGPVVRGRRGRPRRRPPLGAAFVSLPPQHLHLPVLPRRPPHQHQQVFFFNTKNVNFLIFSTERATAVSFLGVCPQPSNVTNWRPSEENLHLPANSLKPWRFRYLTLYEYTRSCLHSVRKDYGKTRRPKIIEDFHIDKRGVLKSKK